MRRHPSDKKYTVYTKRNNNWGWVSYIDTDDYLTAHREAEFARTWPDVTSVRIDERIWSSDDR